MSAPHAARAHSRIGPSSMHRWGNCPGSVKMSEGIESTTSVYAEEGTRAHELAEWCLRKNKHPGDYKGKLEIDDEMIENVWEYVRPIQERAINERLLVEQRFDITHIHPELFGTGDAVLINPVTMNIEVIDLKYGSGLAVEVKDNEQLLTYAVGALILPDLPSMDTVTLTICQPRCYHPDGRTRSVTYTTAQVRAWAEVLREKAHAATDDLAPLSAGDWCHWCPAAHKCYTLDEYSTKRAMAAFTVPAVKGDPYDPARLSRALDMIPIVEAWVTSVRDFANAEAAHGRVPSGYKMVQKVARRKWLDEAGTPAILTELFGLDESDFMEHSIKSPAVVEKLLPKSEKKMLDELVIKESSGLTLVHESDKRQSAGTDAATVFAA